MVSALDSFASPADTALLAGLSFLAAAERDSGFSPEQAHLPPPTRASPEKREPSHPTLLLWRPVPGCLLSVCSLEHRLLLAWATQAGISDIVFLHN